MLLPLVALVGFTAWIVYDVTHPPRRPYLVTPEKFTLLSDRGLRATNENWSNADGTQARGWLLRGGIGQPAVVLLHRYGADRSWLLNLGVKLSETTNYTVLCPDLRGHGEDPPIGSTSLGGLEADDVSAAVAFLRSLKTPQGQPLVGNAVGLYGVEMGAYAALISASRTNQARALVLDSAPSDADHLLRTIVNERAGFENGFLQQLARFGTRLYFLGGYGNSTACQAAASLRVPVLLLSGADANSLRASTINLAVCFTNKSNVEVSTDLPLTGFNLASAPGQQGEAYDRRVIDFFDRALRVNP